MEGDAGNLELGQEVEYTLSSRTGPGGKVSAENVRLLAKGTLPMPKVSVVSEFLLERGCGKRNSDLDNLSQSCVYHLTIILCQSN